MHHLVYIQQFCIIQDHFGDSIDLHSENRDEDTNKVTILS